MTKSAILERLNEVTSKLGELRVVLEQLPDAVAAGTGASTADPRSKEPLADRARGIRFVDKQNLKPVVDQAFLEMGIQGEPIGAENVQALIAMGGVKPEENILSQAIIEMREE